MKTADGYVAIPTQASRDESRYGPCTTLEALVGILSTKGLMPQDIKIVMQYDGKRGSAVHENLYSQPADSGKGRVWLAAEQISEKPNAQ